jgi:glycolate oxidase FAD binding subunit
MSGFSDVVVYEPEELILDVGAGCPLDTLEAMIAARGQHFAFEPPDYSALWGASGSGTIGGVMACNMAGPRRIKMGAARDHVLGMRCVTGRGDIVQAGARVVKNVTGYDLPKLVTGSFGTLAAVTSYIIKVLPAPETEETVVLAGVGDEEAVQAMSLAMQSAAEVAGAAYVPGEGAYLRLEGIAPSVSYRRDMLGRVLGRPIEVMAARRSQAKWKAIRDAALFADRPSHPLWRLSVTPSDAPGIVRALSEQLDIRHAFDWAGGLVWIEVPPSEDGSAGVIRKAMRSGHATLVRAEAAVRAAADVFEPQAPALATLSARVKESFDPRHIFNPGRMYRGI